MTHVFSNFFAIQSFWSLPNDLSPGPRKFTKLTKPPLAMLRMQGYTVARYIDDIIAIDQSFEECLCGRNNKFVSKTGLSNTSK